MTTYDAFPRLTPDEAAALIPHGAAVGFSGFTPAGSAKAVPLALARKARAEHEAGREFSLRVLTGASTGAHLDDALAEAKAISWRAPFQSSSALRKQINAQQVSFVDMHLSHVPQMIEAGFFGNLDVAVIEATDLTADGRVYLSTSVGNSPSFLHHADKVIIEVNRSHSKRLWEMHDIAILPPPPHRPLIPLTDPLAKLGTPFASVDPACIVGVVETDETDGIAPFTTPDATSRQIAEHIVTFLLSELRAGRIPPEFLPLQAGVGNVSNAVMATLGAHPEIPPFSMFTEVVQDSVIDLLDSGTCLGASTSALTLSDAAMQRVFANMDRYGKQIVLRPQELSNNPEVIRRLGVIAINTVLEMDIYGMGNSTHVCGTQLVNGIGGSGDFVRNAYLSILVAPSVAKGGDVSTVVPMVSHVDHTEHSVQVLVTEQGLVDLRGLGPMDRAHAIIETCAHPDYRDVLRRYVETSRMGHFRHDLTRCFELHRRLLETGSMREA